jgi:hypothetical protein
MNVATPMVNPMTVRAALNLWARIESTASEILSAMPII